MADSETIFSEELEVDWDRCVGSGTCELEVPEAFVLVQSAGKATVRSGVPLPSAVALDVIDSCPTSAIRRTESTSRRRNND